MRVNSKGVICSAALAGLALVTAFWAPFAPAGASSTGNFLVTLYGWPDNSPPGGDIAYPVLHHRAGGTGSYADPITFATDRSELPRGTKVYVPFLHRYFIMEDDCAECDADWAGHGPDGGPRLHHIDLWAGGEGARHSHDVISCEDKLTRSSTSVITDPPATEPVDTTPLFSSGREACYDPGSFHPSAPTTTRRSPSPAASPAAAPHKTKPSFAAVTGSGCRRDSKARFTEHGRSGVINVRSGGLRADGCDGSFDAMPVSGSTTYDNPGTYATWTFHTAPITRGVCHINLYVPDDASTEHVGGHPAIYEVFGAASTSGPELGTFDVDQIFNHGHWVSRHNWRITSGTLTVKLDNRGTGSSGSSRASAHIAMSAVRVTCTT